MLSATSKSGAPPVAAARLTLTSGDGGSQSMQLFNSVCYLCEDLGRLRLSDETIGAVIAEFRAEAGHHVIEVFKAEAKLRFRDCEFRLKKLNDGDEIAALSGSLRYAIETTTRKLPDTPRVSVPALKIASGARQGVTISLECSPFTIGRELTMAATGLSLEDPFLSILHCLIEASGSNYEIIDLASKNGTFLNGRRISRTPLRHGDRITAGATEFIFLDAAGSIRRLSRRSRLLGLALAVLTAAAIYWLFRRKI